MYLYSCILISLLHCSNLILFVIWFTFLIVVVTNHVIDNVDLRDTENINGRKNRYVVISRVTSR